jgi:hypothetical protein
MEKDRVVANIAGFDRCKHSRPDLAMIFDVLLAALWPQTNQLAVTVHHFLQIGFAMSAD